METQYVGLFVSNDPCIAMTRSRSTSSPTKYAGDFLFARYAMESVALYPLERPSRTFE